MNRIKSGTIIFTSINNKNSVIKKGEYLVSLNIKHLYLIDLNFHCTFDLGLVESNEILSVIKTYLNELNEEITEITNDLNILLV
ncbi:hypothetical protein SR42_15085 [Clostridium botulinum]|uniref:hypothetical protein n=1 Tax=Clostridium botulinum TaxID=1491 RepID=UPI000597AEC9|nr:hypothetical protein [Clostridium botulinum]KIL06894.1 hypothetical protein SR42_15085 [Clostridium botulinum]MBY6935315.1 hypothetical protein [Clostridium botulinum]NFL82055.1 hypothetical protein [Clostridium botulinum]NFN13191.1 hypothetical protein [Clostridium botulinum]NFO38200.1 hypothetical protein [Clostridium botulinum]